MNKKWNLFPLLAISSLFIFSCQEKFSFPYPLVYTGEVTHITDSSAQFNAKIVNISKKPVTAYGFEWGIAGSSRKLLINGGTTTDDLFSFQSNYKLLPGEEYYVQSFVRDNSGRQTYGKRVYFKTPSIEQELGTWSNLINDNFSSQTEYIRYSFTIDSTTYLAFNDGTLYGYDHKNNRIDYNLSNEIVGISSIGIAYNDIVYLCGFDSLYTLNPKDNSTISLVPVSHEGFWIGYLYDDRLIFLEKDLAAIWEYNIIGNNLESLKGLGRNYRVASIPFNFSLNETGFFAGKWYTDSNYELWYYSNEGHISELSEFTGELPISNHDFYEVTGTGTKDFGYCFSKGEFFEFNPLFYAWVKKPTLENVKTLSKPHMFSYNNDVFVVYASNENGEKFFKLWKYEE